MNPSITEMIEARVKELDKKCGSSFAVGGFLTIDFGDKFRLDQGLMNDWLRTTLTEVAGYAREEERTNFMEIIKWLNGEVGEFPECPDGKRYCWRTEMMRRVSPLTAPDNKV